MNNALISLDQIICSWLGKRGYTIHYYVNAALYAHEAVQELQFTSMPLLHHKLITRVDADKYFTLPQGCTRVVKAGVRIGDRWWPLAIEDSLIPFPNHTGNGDMLAADFDDDLNTGGGYQSWYNGQTTGGSFSSGSFGAGFSTGTTTAGTAAGASAVWASGGYYGACGWCPTCAPYAGIAINEQTGLIAVPELFPFTEIYLMYIGIADIDNMSEIPLYGQAAIESYMTWKHEGTRDAKNYFDEQHRLLRARMQPLGTQDIEAIFNRAFFPANGQLRYTLNSQSANNNQ